MKLTKSEKMNLVLEGIITAGIILLMYLAAYQIVIWIVSSNPAVFEQFWIFDQMIVSIQNRQVWDLTPLFLVFLVVIAVVAIYWRLKRRHRQYELLHIIDELHYIAEGNYEHRISGDYQGDLQNVVDSIHMLVDSTVEAMEEERRIEQTKDDLITNVSHDIRTPLTSIIGYLGLIEQDRFQETDEALEYVHRAYGKSKQMKALVDDLFEYTKVRQTSTPLNIIQFDMLQLLEQLVIDFEIEANNKDMEITVDSEYSQMHMEGDTEKIVRLFNNLISNALKYGEEGREVRIEVGKEENNVIIRVKNVGDSLSDEALEQIFERFYRAEKSRSQEVSGTGLGLAISKSIVELHHGTISARAEDGWTIFETSIPLEHNESDETKKNN